uniref:Venom dipeptidyl peptidase 4 n=1 Tax=Timema bartmani TaxID=61472 RepID=A0A7R9HX42_9NEOP|nr:unnamed protein product [Timema bartmani]
MSDREEVQRAHSLGSGGVELSLISGRSVESHRALSDEMGDIDRRSILVELRCIVVLLALSCAAVETEARTVVDQPRVIGQPFSLEEIIGGVFSQRGFGGTWVSGTEFIFADSVTGDILRYDVTTGTKTTLVLKEVLTAYNAGGYTLSPDGLYLLLSYDTQSHATPVYSVYSNVSGASYLQLARWSPRGSALVFVLDNNIFYRPNASNETEHQITRTGEPGVYYNGVPDWVYEEEVFGSGSAFWISPSGDSLAFAVFNDTEVNEFSYFLYGTPGDLEDQYVTLRTIKYPKSGTTNPHVSFKVVDLTQDLTYESITVVDLPAPTDIVTDDHILYTVTWPTDSAVVATWTNRVQNVAVITSYNLSSGVATTVHQWGEPEGWLTPGTPLFDDAGTRFVTILSESQGEVDGDFNHVILIDTSSGERRALTSGRYTVTSIYGWNIEAAIISVSESIALAHLSRGTDEVITCCLCVPCCSYYLGTGVDAPTNRHVYSVTEGGVNTCLSCSIQTPEGNTCLYSTATFSKDLSHYTITCSGPDPAYRHDIQGPVSLQHQSSYPATVTIFKASSSGDDATVQVWESNEAFRESVSGRSYPNWYTTQVPVDGGFNATVRLWLPPGLDTSGDTKYPMLVYVYGGPNSNQINDAYTLSFGTYLATNRSIIYGLIDGRGSLQQRLPYIDASRTAIWGWSYGGYATAMALAKDTEGVFKCGASVAPVSSWIYYDTIYTERFMGLPTPEDNESGYNQSDVTRLIDNFKNKQFFLMHGNADDNVHYQQAMTIARSLQLADILFNQQSYPDENHSLGGVSLHVYHALDAFWTKCFQ